MDAPRILEGFLDRSDIPFERVASDRWVVQLSGERKLTIPIGVRFTGDRLEMESFFMRRPQENLAAFYELLLRRNRSAYGVAFALDADGDVFLVCKRPASAVDDDELDRLFGAFLVEADGLFNAAIAIGFESYLAADMRWRAAARNDT